MTDARKSTQDMNDHISKQLESMKRNQVKCQKWKPVESVGSRQDLSEDRVSGLEAKGAGDPRAAAGDAGAPR